MALKLESDDSGLREGSDLQFKITDDKTSKTQGTVDYFGLNNVQTQPMFLQPNELFQTLFFLNFAHKKPRS